VKHNDFKENYEALATQQFLPAYNALMKTHFRAVPCDRVAPDVFSQDTVTGEILNLEITFATVSPHGPLVWRAMLEGTYKSPGAQKEDDQIEVQACADNINKKFDKRYGSNVALVVFHWGPIVPWHEHLDLLHWMVDFDQSPFDKGVWLLSWRRLHKLDCL